MRNRGMLTLAIIAILLGSLIPISNDVELEDLKQRMTLEYEDPPLDLIG